MLQEVIDLNDEEINRGLERSREVNGGLKRSRKINEVNGRLERSRKINREVSNLQWFDWLI